MNKRLILTLANINASYIKKKKWFDIEHSKSIIELCDFLISLKVIQGYTKITKTRFHNKYVILKKYIRIFMYTLESGSQFNFSQVYSTGDRYSSEPQSSFLFKPYNRLEILSKPSRIHYSSHTDIQKKLCINKITVIKTKYGFLTDFQCSRSRIGGILFFNIIL